MAVFDTYRTGEKNPESRLCECNGCDEMIPITAGEKSPPCASCGVTTSSTEALAGKAGQKCETGKNTPESGLFLCTTCKKQTIPISNDDNFPPCAACQAGTKWQVIVHA